MMNVNCIAAQNEALKSELKTVSGYLEAAQRNVQMFKAEAASLQAQLDAKERSLHDATLENHRLCQHLIDGDLADRKQQKAEKLKAKVSVVHSTTIKQFIDEETLSHQRQQRPEMLSPHVLLF